MTYPVYISDQKFKNSMDLLMISNENKSNYEHIKDFERFVFSETKSKKKNYFAKAAYSFLVIKMYL